MAKFNEMSFAARLGIMLLIAAVVGVAYYYVYLNPEVQQNEQLKAKINDKKRENEQLRQFEPKLADLNRQMAILQQQMDIQKKIVPEDKDADQFIRLLHDTASTSGIEIRRYTSMPVANHEFYSDVPFAIDIDGPYYSVLNFFQRVSELERIVNIDNLQMTNTKNTGAAKVKGQYQWSPGETVVASCTATTFFSHEAEPAPPAGTPGKPGQPATAAPAK
ncbi:MAG TPA: type 4a pilus biogenesis protein PilO [Candidatus Angelobacter sp.]|jgi:type IV pilus assembly protein PilO|nr:type 4a pilus biogenesis protein PilO [Candidatus Angelobacter sp.]